MSEATFRRDHWMVALRDSDLDKAAKFIGMTMATYANNGTGVLWVKQSTLAEKTGYTVRTVRAAQNVLREGGFAELLAPHVKGRKPATYRLVIPRVSTTTDMAAGNVGGGVGGGDAEVDPVADIVRRLEVADSMETLRDLWRANASLMSDSKVAKEAYVARGRALKADRGEG